METIIIYDKSQIDEVVFHHPELMGDNAETLIKEKYSSMMKLEDSLYSARENVRKLEGELRKAKEEWDSIKSWFTYTHPPKEEKEVINNTISLGIIGHGNDIIGKTSII